MAEIGRPITRTEHRALRDEAVAIVGEMYDRDPIVEVWERFRHLDHQLSAGIERPAHRWIRRDLWLAVKTYVGTQEEEKR